MFSLQTKLQQELSNVSDNPSKSANMTDAVMDEMHMIVREAMASCPGRSVKEQTAHAARQLKIEFRRARGLYYREARAILAHEVDQLRAWYRDFCDSEYARCAARMAEIEMRQKALRGKQNAVVDMAVERAGLDGR